MSGHKFSGLSGLSCFLPTATLLKRMLLIWPSQVSHLSWPVVYRLLQRLSHPDKNVFLDETMRTLDVLSVKHILFYHQYQPLKRYNSSNVDVCCIPPSVIHSISLTWFKWFVLSYNKKVLG